MALMKIQSNGNDHGVFQIFNNQWSIFIQFTMKQFSKELERNQKFNIWLLFWKLLNWLFIEKCLSSESLRIVNMHKFRDYLYILIRK